MFTKATVLLAAAVALTQATATPKYAGVHIYTEDEDEAAGYPRQYEEFVPDVELMSAMPAEFTWGNKDGVNYLTPMRNQHIPQYCGSCWGMGAVSSISDRIKIARGARGVDIQVSIQHILNCRGGGSCHGGSTVGPYKFMKNNYVSYETSNPYIACSHESKEGFCAHVDTTCTPINVARTCSTFSANGGACLPIVQYPNVTISDYKSIRGVTAMQSEIFQNGPISCGIDAMKVLDYTGGIVTAKGNGVDHVISVVGWGNDAKLGQYWIIRNSWGEYWGEMGFLRAQFGSINVESQCAAGTGISYTAPELGNQVHCYEDGTNCQ